MAKQMEGDNRERRKKAKEARDEGKRPSEMSATTGASKQIKSADSNASHEERLDQKDEGKQRSARRGGIPTVNPRSRESGPDE
jgi:hypothetical protein